MSEPTKPAFDAVAYEDVLAARVLRKALNALAVVIAFVVLVIGLAWRDLSKEGEAIREQRKALAVAQKELSQQVDSMRTAYASTSDSLLSGVARAGALVQGAKDYQAALANQLVEYGRNTATMARTQKEIEAARSDADAALRLVGATRDDHVQRIAADTASVNALRRQLADQVAGALLEARMANHLVLNRWSQVVEEERLTPVADSRFWVKFDDIRENDLTNTVVEYENGFGRKTVGGIPQTLRVGEPARVTMEDGSRYVVLAQAKYREKAPPLGLGHNDRVVFRIDRLASDSTLNLAVASGSERHAPR
ncbi:MAG: hypothetical protein AB1941_18600 [Gemmatimonadota bacterium]